MQPISFLNDTNELVPKGIQKVLEERGLWLAKGLKLSYLNPKCFNYLVFAECKICIKSHKYYSCKEPQ